MAGGETTYVVKVGESEAGLVADLGGWLSGLVKAAPESRLLVAVSGGSMVGLLGKVFQWAKAEGLDWSGLRLGLADERLVAEADPESTRGAYAALLKGLPDSAVSADQLLGPVDPSLPVDAAAKAYEALVRAEGAGGFDVVLLGLGPDGHTASLFPGHAAFLASLKGEDKGRLFVPVTESPKPPPNRVSLTLGALAETAAVALVATGAAKEAVLAKALNKEPDCLLPIAHVSSKTRTVHVFADAQAVPRKPN